MASRTDSTTTERRLIDLLSRQESIVDRLASLAGRQRPMIDGGRTDELLGLLAERQVLIDEFIETSDDVGRLAEALDDDDDALPGAARDRMSAHIRRLAHRVGEVVERDRRDQTQLEPTGGLS